jgi:hypothetical protein
VKKVLHDSIEIAPFVLTDRDHPEKTILVLEPGEAEGLMDDLEVTHNQFIPAKTTAVQAGIDRLFGEVRGCFKHKNIQTTLNTSFYVNYQ